MNEGKTSTPHHPETGIKIPFAGGIDFQLTIMANLGQTVVAVKHGENAPMEVLQFKSPMEAIGFVVDHYLNWSDGKGLLPKEEA